MRAYSMDLSQRVLLLAAADRGTLREEIVLRARVWSLPTDHKPLAKAAPPAERRARRRRRRGPCPRSVRRRASAVPPSRAPRPLWEQQLEANPELTLERHRQMWEEQQQQQQQQGVRVSMATMSRAIRKLGWSYKKKSVGASEPDEEARRSAWREQVSGLHW